MLTFLQTMLVTIAGATVASLSSWAVAIRSIKAKAASRSIEAQRVEVDSRLVEGEAYAKAQKISDLVVSGLHNELDYLRKDLAAERAGRVEDNRRHAAEVAELHRLIERLRSDLEVTRAQLNIPEARNREK